MKLRLPHRFQAALLAAIASVSFTTLSSGTQVQAAMQDAVWDFEGSIEAQTGITGLGYEFIGGTATYVDSNIFIGRDLTSTQVSLANLGQAIDISSSQYIRVTDNGYWSTGDGALKLGNSPTNNFTISVWTKLDAISGERFILGTSDGDNMGFSFAMENGGKLDFLAKAVAHHDVSNTTAPMNQWVNLTITYDASTGASTGYINGDSIGSITLNNVGFKNGGGNLGIGSGSANQKQASFDGQIASLSILSGAMTAEQVKAQTAVAADTLGTYTWSATDAGSDWADAVWTKDSEGGQYFQNISNAVFGADAAVTTVGVRSTTHAHDVTLGGTYTFNLADGVELTMNKLTLENAASAAFNSTGSASMQIGTVAGPGTITAGQGVDIRAYNINAGSGTVTIAGAGSVTTTECASGNVAVSSGSTWKLGGSGNWTYSGVLSGAGNIEKIGAGTLTLSAQLSNNYSGGITVSEGTLVSRGTASNFHDVYVAQGATLALEESGWDFRFRYTLAGGTLSNIGTTTHTNHVQNDQVSLAANSYVNANSTFYMLGGSFGATYLNLNGHTLTKTGAGIFDILNGHVNAGTIVVEGGAIGFEKTVNKNNTADVKASFVLKNAGADNLQGRFKLSGNASITALETLSASAAIELGANVTMATNVASGKTLTMSGAITGAGTIDKQGDGNLVLNGATTIAGTIANEGGDLALNGAVTLNTNNIAAFEVFDSTGQTYSYAAKGSGFLSNPGQYYLVKGTGSATASHGTSITGGSYVDDAPSKGAGDIIVTFTPAGTTYYVNQDMSTTEDNSTMLGSSVKDISIKKGVTLTASASGDTFTGPAKLHGEGTYALASGAYAMNSGLTLGADWSGTVRLTNASATSLIFGNLTNGSQSTLELKGFTGYSKAWNGTNVQNIKLTTPDGGGVAWNATDAATSKDNNTAIYSGTWSGDGTMTIAPNKLNYTFSGDISQWTGKLQTVSNYNNTFNLTFTGNAQAIKAEIVGQHNTNKMNLVVDTNATFSKNVTANTLTVNPGWSATLQGDGTLGALAGAGSLVVNGGTVTVNGTDDYSGAVNVTSGTLDLTSTVATGNLSVANGATLKFAGEEMLTVGGDLALNGILDVSRINYSEGATVTLASYTGTANITGYTLTGLGDGHSGYLSTSDKTLTLTFTAPAPELIWDASKSNKWNTTDDNWHVGTAGAGTSRFSEGDDVKFTTSPGGTVSLDGNITAGNITIEDGANISIQNNGYKLAGKLQGSGTYALAPGVTALPDDLNVSDSGWTGTVKLTNVSGAAGNNINLNTYGHAGSKVEMDGVDGYFYQDQAIFAPELVLSGNGLTLINGFSTMPSGNPKPPTTYTFAGGVSGTGDMTFSKTDSTVTQNIYFTGDVGKWEGNLQVVQGFTVIAQFSGAADMVNAGISRTGGTLDLKVGDGTNDFSTTFKKSVVASTLTINEHASATFENLLSASTITGTGDLYITSTGTLKLAGPSTVSVGSLTLASGSVLDVSNITQMAGLTVGLASYTGTVSYEGATVSGISSSLDYTLNATDGMLTLTFAGKPQPTPTPVADLGKVMYVGDSITDGVSNKTGVNAKSWRYSFFQVLADGGISQVEEGYYQHTQSSGAITTTTYGGRTFENIHSAKASARSWETAGVPTSQKGGDRYDYTSIQNWLGQRETKRNGQAYPADKPRYSGDDAPNTYFMLLGTNDLLSEGGNHIGESHFNSVLSSMFGYSGGSFDGQSGTFDIIWKSMTDERSDAKLVVLEMPTWSPNHVNHEYASDFAYLAKFNQKLHEWADNKANKAQITIVNPNPGIVDVANTTKPGSGVPTMFIDGLHPSAQGELLMAGNVAKQLGYAGRSVGLDRAAYTAGSTEWHTAGAEPITVVAGDPAQTIDAATGTFTVRDGYTIDFSAVYGNGLAGGWSEASNALSITVGDGSHTGTLSFSEAYVMWDNTILYSRDNHVAGDNFRIAYVNKSVTPTDNVSAGYYVWMGDQLIGEALTATTGTGLLNGIQLSATGANGTVSGLTWADKAYAPTTELYVNEDEAFHLEQAYANPVHDNPDKQGVDNTIVWESTNSLFTLPQGQSSAADILYKELSTTIGAHYTGAANAFYEGKIGMRYTGTVDMDARQSVLSVFSATVNGDVYMQFDNPNTVYNSFTNTDRLSVTASYNGNITGRYTAVYNAGIFNYDVRGGEHNDDGYTIGKGSYSYVNGGTFKANVMGGGRKGTINGGTHVTVTGGEIAGSVYGGGIGGTINDGTLVTITGGIIKGDVNGGGIGGTINDGTAVVIEGNLPSIGGNITADEVTLRGVKLNEDGYNDGFDWYSGTITGTETITLDNYTVADMRAALVTKTLVLSGESSTTIHNLTLTACTITADENTDVTLADSLTLGNTATFSGDVSLADNLTIDVSALMQGSPGDRITLFSGTEGSTLGVNDLSSISVTGSGVEDYHLTLGSSGQYLYLDRNTAALIPWHEPSENVIGYQGLNQTASGTFVAGDDVQEIPGHTGTGVYTSVTSGTNVSALYANQGAHTGDVYMLVNGVTMINKSGAYGWIAAHNSGMLTGNASVKVENTNNAPAMLFGVVGGNVTGNVYTEVDDGTFASFTTKEAKASYAGSYQGNITGEARLVTAGGTFEYDVYGGVHTNVDQGTNSIGSTKLDLRGGAFKGNVYGGGRTGSVTGATNVIVSGTAEVDGSVYGGGNGGTVGGSTNVTISGDVAQVKGNVYGNTAATQGGTVTLKDRTNGFGDDSHVIVTEALNLQNTQGAVSSQIKAETVNLTGDSIVTINNLTLTPTSDTDTCALTMATGSALTLDGTLSLSKAANYSGSLALTDGMTLDLSRMNLSGMEESVTLLNSSSGNLSYTDLNTIQINAPSATYEAYNLSVDTNNNLVLTFVQSTDGLIWDGSVNDRWSNQPTDTNWHNVDENPGSDYFTATSDVVFEPGESATIVDISENISAGTVMLRSGADVTLHTDPLVAQSLATPRLSVADGSTLTVDANVALTTSAITGSGTVSLRDGTKLELTGGVDNNGTLNVGGGAIVKLAGTDMLAVQNLNLGTGSVIDVSNIEFTDGNTVKIADIDGRLDFPSRNPEHGLPTDQPVARVAVTNYQGDLTDVVHLVYDARKEIQSGGIYYFNDAELFLVKENPGLYWNNRDDNGKLADGLWDADYDYIQKGQKTHHDGEANWNSVLDPDATNKVIGLQQTAYFISEKEDSTVTISVAPNISDQTGEPGNTQVATMVIGGGGTFNFVRQDPDEAYDIVMSSNKATSLIVRKGTTAHFEMNVVPGEYSQFEIEQNAVLDILDSQYTEAGGGIIHNQGLFNYSTMGYTDLQAVVNEGVANIGRVWGEDGKKLVPELPYVIMHITRVYNEPGAEMTLSADQILQKESSGCIIQNEGELTFRTDEAGYGLGLSAEVPVSGMGVVKTVGTAPIYFEASYGLPATVDGSALEAGAKLTDFSNRVTITDTTTLTAEDFAKDQSDKRSTTVFNYSSQLGEHVVMGGNTTLDLNTGSEANPEYTMGEVHSATAGTDQNLIVRSGVTANVADGVSLPDGKAQVAGGGKLTIGGATSTVGELAATGGGTAVVELNGATAEGTDLVLNAKRLSNTDSTSEGAPVATNLRVVNTKAVDTKSAQFNIGDATPEGGDYKGTLQYGVGAHAASGSGMNLTIKDNNVAAGAILEAYYDEDAPQSASVNVVVDTDAAKVVGLSDNISGPDEHRTMVVSGSGDHQAQGATNNSLEITGDGNYTYAGKLGEKLDIAYTGDGSQTIEDGVSKFNGAVTVDNGTTEEGVLAILKASSVSITDLTIGANDKLNVKQGNQGSQADGMTTVTGTLTARGGSSTASKLDSNLTMDERSTLDVSAAGGTGGLNLTGTLTINDGALLSATDFASVKDLGWFEMYDLAFGVTDMIGFGQVDWSEGVDVTEVFANTGLKAEEYYVRYSQNEAGGNGTNVGAVYIYHIPEPTTGTLSLLALMALAARRRRKG